MRIRGF